MYYLEQRQIYCNIYILGEKVYRYGTKIWVRKAECVELTPIQELYEKLPTEEKRFFRVVDYEGEKIK